MQFEVSSQDLHRVRKSAKRKRASVACARCKASKIKCSGYWPCKRCNDSNVACCFDSGPFNGTSRKTQYWSDPASVEPCQSWSPYLLSGFGEFKGSMTDHCTMGSGQVGEGRRPGFEGKVTADVLRSDGFAFTSGADAGRIEVGWPASLIQQTPNPALINQPTPVEICPPTTTNLPDLLQTLRSF
jgi:hypothetical protein